ncbi:hypothetical protein HPP92_016202 [Vanilla planifolia]|uniref:THH1/TOM1/TOM3 domain-containing protein n=1 Tax=Vanilla planifolia TaxID=51239 RepID=A0A835UTZ7_VANPL|nr:hypothetical protein HPP92_016202 [Vanilla planifolia]
MRPLWAFGSDVEVETTLALVASVAGRGIEWWNEIDESEEWQRGLYHALCGCFSLLSLVALVQLMRIQVRVPEFNWTTQKLFHFMNFIVNGLRAVLFGLYQNVFLLKPKVLEMLLLDLPGLLFFSSYTLLVLFWAEIYQLARDQPSKNLKPAYITVNGIIYVIQMCIWVYVQVSPRPIALEIAKLFFAVVSFSAALGFIIYGGRLFFLLKHLPVDSRGRRKKVKEVGFVSGICITCFFIRCIMVAVSAFDKDAYVDVLDHPILNFIYYMAVEILPSALVLFILRKLPPKRISYQYQPIR